MDKIQKALIKAGRKDLAQKYYKKVAASTLIDRLQSSRPGLSNIEILVHSSPEEYIVTLKGGVDNTSFLLGRFQQGKIVPDLKAEKKAIDFAKKLKSILKG